MRSISARNVIFALERFFSFYSITNNIVSDNGPPFASCELEEYIATKRIRHHRTNPLWPQAKGQLERFMPFLNKRFSQTAFLERKDWKLEVYTSLFSYRNYPNATTKIPSNVMFNRKVKFTIPHIGNKINIDNITNKL